MLQLSPLREPRANKISTTIYHFSHKLGRQVWCESNLEWNVAILLDHDPHVIDFCEQTKPKELEKDITWTPDFVVLYDTGQIQVLEIKYQIDLFSEKHESYVEKYDKTEKICKENGFEFLVISDKTVHKSSRLENCRKLMEAKNKTSKNITLENHIIASVQAIEPRTISEIYNHLISWKEELNVGEEDILTYIYYLLYDNTFDLDFEELITNTTLLLLSNSNRIESLEIWLKSPFWKDIQPTSPKSISLTDLHSIPKTLFKEAERRFEIISPLLKSSTEDDVENISKIHDVSRTTIWRWLSSYRENNDFRDLIPKYQKRGAKKTDPNHPLLQVGFKTYLDMKKPTIKHAYNVMEAEAEKLNQLDTLPSYQTFRRRINELDKERVLRKRQGTRKSEKVFQQSNDTFPHADWALQTIQIDHTPIDVRVVDEEDRLVVDRPFLTVALDIHSRVVLGYTVTYDKPSRLSIAMTLINCVDEKYKVLKKVRETFPELDEETLDMIENSEWGLVRGLPSTLHMDNGKDFVSDDIKLFGKAYKVNLHYRPVKGARYGAHVERFLGTLNKRLHNISGTTFSNIKEKGDYESDKHATYTIDELEARILSELVLYHDDYHQGIKTTPIKVWKDSFKFENPQTSQGLNIPKDLERFKLDILPSEERTVQREGVSVFGMYYNSPDLRRWIRAKDPSNKQNARKFIIRYDPRDIRSIYFYDPDKKAYIQLLGKDPFMMRLFADRAFSLWEYRSINSEIVKNGLREVKSRQKQKIIASQQEMDEIAKKRTQAQRKRKSKKRNRTKKRKEDYQEIDRVSSMKITPDEDVEDVVPYETDIDKIRDSVVGMWSGEEEDEDDE